MRRYFLCSLLFALLVAVMPAFGTPIFEIPTSADPFGLLGGTIINTGLSEVIGDVGATTKITGFSPTGTATGFFCTPTSAAPCTSGDDSAVTTAYDAIFNTGGAFSTASDLTSTESLTDGLNVNTTFLGNNVYTATSTISTTTGITLTFDAEGNPNAVFVIQVDGDLTVNGAVTFKLEGGAQASNIFWIVKDAATISPSVPITFDGDILAGSSFTMSHGTSGAFSGTINGCVFARTANTLAAETDVNGCSTGSSVGPPPTVPEPRSAGLLVSLGGLLGILAWTRKRRQLL
jgi:hypothetical protein